MKKSEGSCAHGGSMLTELRKGRALLHRMDPNLPKKICNKSRGEIS